MNLLLRNSAGRYVEKKDEQQNKTRQKWQELACSALVMSAWCPQHVWRKTGIRSVSGLTEFAREHGLDDPSMVTPGKPYRVNPQMRGFFSKR